MTWGQLSLALSRKAPNLPIDEIADSLNRAYDGILRERRWRALFQSTVLVTAAPVSGGTVTVTADSAAVVGSGTAFSGEMVGRIFQVVGSNEVYSVAEVTDETNLTLDRVFAETTAAGASYRITQDVYSLGVLAREVVSVEFPGGSVPVEGVSLEELRQFCPIPGTEGQPRIWAPYHDVADTYTGIAVARLVLAPTPDAVYGLKVNYIVVARGFDGSNTEESPMPFVDDAALYGAALVILTLGQAGQDLKAEGLRRMKVEDNRRTGPQRIMMDARYTEHRLRRWTR